MKQLTYTLYLREGVLATAPGGDPNTDESLPYIPGSLIRGAIIARYLANGGDSQSDAFTQLFLDGSVRYLNAYPLGEESPVRTLPAPYCWVQEKDSTASDALTRRRVYDMRHEATPIPSKGIGSGFTYLGMSAETPQRAVVYQQSPTFSTAVHTSRNRLRGRAVPGDDDSALFRYKALAPRQYFAGVILLPDDPELPEYSKSDDVQNLLADPLLLGGSTTAGYGLVEVTDSQVKPVANTAKAIPAQSFFTLYFASNAILRDPQTGQAGPFVAEWLQKKWGVEITVQESFSRMTWVGGFNATWGLPLPQTWAVQMGSVYVLRAEQEISAKQVQHFLEQGMGQRLAEGFGEVQIDPGWPAELYGPPSSQEVPFKPSAAQELDWPELAQLESKMLARMNRDIASQELDRLLAAAANQAAHNFRGPLSNSQVARLRLRIRPEVNQPDKAFADFKQYLQGTHERKSANDQFNKSRIKNTNFRVWMEELVKNPAKVWEQLSLKTTPGWIQDPITKQYSRLFLGAAPVVLDAAMSHTYAVRLIEAVCTLIANKEGRHA